MSAPECQCETETHFRQDGRVLWTEVARMDLECPFHFPNSEPYSPKGARS